MKKLVSNFELFSLRHGESIAFCDEPPKSGRWIGVMIQPTFLPDGERSQVRDLDGAPVEMAAIVACQKGDNGWQWLQLSPETKEHIGDILFDCGAERERWYYVAVLQSNHPETPDSSAKPSQ